MVEPIISVVIPAYNREREIVRAVDSVLIQGIESMEILVIDDCSTDNTAQVVTAMNDPRIHLIRHDKNKGEARARNTGVRVAKGKYVAYLDSDDYWLPGKLKAQLKAMDNAPDDVGGCYTLHKRLYQNGKMSVAGGGIVPTFETMLVKGISISTGPTLMFRRELFEIVGDYDETAPLYVDWDWMLRFLKMAKLKRIDTPYAVYEKNPQYRRGEVLEHAAAIFIDKFKKDIDELPPKNRHECLARINLDIARGYAENESRMKALPFYWKAIKMKPFMSPGSYINMFDGLTGLKTLPYIDALVRRAKV